MSEPGKQKPPPPVRAKGPPPTKVGPGPSANGHSPATGTRGRPPGKKPGAKDVDFDRRPLPAVIDALDLIGSNLVRPPELVHGVLHRGSKMVIGGGSKSFKTWALVDLAISVAAGVPWWGFDTERGRVLYMNFEIQDYFFGERLSQVMTAKACQPDPGQLTCWGLRGHAADLRVLMPELISTLKEGDYSLIVFDPIYKGLGDRDENRAGDIASLLNEIERLAVETGAAVVFGHHFSKGNQSGKESIDRIGGSGVFSRDPDSILTMTRHETEDAFVVDAVLRNLAPIDKFVVRRQHPLMVRDDDLDPDRLKQAKGVAQEKYTDDSILAPLKAGKPLSKQAWFNAAQDVLGIARPTFDRRASELISQGLAVQLGGDKRTDPWVLAP